MAFPSVSWDVPASEAETQWPIWPGSQMGDTVAPAFHGSSMHCEYCQDPEAFAYFEDPCFDTDTESEYEAGDPEMDAWMVQAGKSPGGMESSTSHVLDIYVLYKRR